MPRADGPDRAAAEGIQVESYYREIAPQPTRLLYKLVVAEEVYEVLIKELSEL